MWEGEAHHVSAIVATFLATTKKKNGGIFGRFLLPVVHTHTHMVSQNLEAPHQQYQPAVISSSRKWWSHLCWFMYAHAYSCMHRVLAYICKCVRYWRFTYGMLPQNKPRKVQIVGMFPNVRFMVTRFREHFDRASAWVCVWGWYMYVYLNVVHECVHAWNVQNMRACLWIVVSWEKVQGVRKLTTYVHLDALWLLSLSHLQCRPFVSLSYHQCPPFANTISSPAYTPVENRGYFSACV